MDLDRKIYERGINNLSNANGHPPGWNLRFREMMYANGLTFCGRPHEDYHIMAPVPVANQEHGWEPGNYIVPIRVHPKIWTDPSNTGK